MTFRNRLSLVKEVWQAFNQDNGFLLAAAVSFYTFLSLFPLLLLVVGVLGFVLGSPEHAEALITRTIGSYVVGPETMAIIGETIHGRDAATGIGLIVLLWSGTSALVVLEQAMNLAWDTRERRGFAKRRLVALVTLLVGSILLAISLGTTTLLHAIGASHSEFAANLGPVWRWLAYPVPAVASVALFMIMYKFLPNAPVSWRTALVGGVLSGVLWEIAKHAFAFYVVRWADYSRVYGSLGGVILMMIWIDYSATITILGAEFASVWSRRRENGTPA